MADIYCQAAQELGYPRADLNGYFTEGCDAIYYPIKHGRRYGVYGAYIEEAMYRPETKLTVRKFAHVKKVYSFHRDCIFSYQNKRLSSSL